MTPPVLRIVGPPGSGKSLLITSLVEALRSRGHRLATVVRRDERTTVIILSHGGRVTIERPMDLEALRGVIAGVDPAVDLVLAEGFADAAVPAVELRLPDHAAMTASGDLFAAVDAAEVIATFAKHGPGETNGLADRIEREILGVHPWHEHAAAPSVPAEGASEPSGRLGRLVRRITGG